MVVSAYKWQLILTEPGMETLWPWFLAPEAIAVTSLFKEGMDSGCTCGALVGMVMISGILQNRYGHPLNDKLAADLTARFRTEFSATCCCVICKQRSLWEKIGRKGCIVLTAKTAMIMEEVWADVRNHADQNLRDYTHAQ